jgi:uncharacterized protein
MNIISKNRPRKESCDRPMKSCGESNNTIVFGSFEPPLSITMDDLSLSMVTEDGTVSYTREQGKELVEKTLLSEKCRIMIHPVEPVNLPRNITSYLLVEFDRPLMVPPRSSSLVYLTFPVEIGVFVAGGKEVDVVDIFSFVRPKFTQYGDLTRGYICRYWRSAVTTQIPETDPLKDGVLHLEVSNPTQEWVELTKVVLNTYEMKIFFADDLVSAKAVTRILKEGMAEADFIDSPTRKGMEHSIELFKSRKNTVMSRKFVMEGGL